MIRYLRSAAADFLMFVTNRMVGSVPSHKFRLFFYRNVMGFEIERHSYILMGAWFDCKKHFRMGAHSVINQKCRLDNRAGLSLGSNVSVSAEVCILTSDHDPRDLAFAGRKGAVRLADYVFVGTRAIILPGVTVGEGAVVAAGAVVTRNVDPYTIVAGCPAKKIGERPRGLDYELSYGRLFL